VLVVCFLYQCCLRRITSFAYSLYIFWGS